MKKVLLIILCLLVVFIPTYIAIGSYNSSHKEPVTVDNVDKLEIVDLNGVKTELTKENDNGFIEFMVSASSSAEKILVLPEPLRSRSQPLPAAYHSDCTQPQKHLLQLLFLHRTFYMSFLP